MNVDSKKFVLALAKSDLTGCELEKKASVSSKVITKAKHGERISPKSAGRLARALGVSVEEIVIAG